MHPALQRLVEANAGLQGAERALKGAQEHRRQCARELAKIEDPTERLDAAVLAYSQFGTGLSLALAEAVTGLPGRKGQAAFLVAAGRRQEQQRGRVAGQTGEPREPMTEWPAPDEGERAVIRAHIDHGKAYRIDHGLGWTCLRASLRPQEAAAYLKDATGALAGHFGLSREAFVEWLSSEGSVRCEGRIASGAPCKSGVAGVSTQLSVEAWKAASEKGGYCTRHGGDREHAAPIREDRPGSP